MPLCARVGGKITNRRGTVARSRNFIGQARVRGHQDGLGAASDVTARGRGMLRTSPRDRGVCFGYQAGLAEEATHADSCILNKYHICYVMGFQPV